MVAGDRPSGPFSAPQWVSDDPPTVNPICYTRNATVTLNVKLTHPGQETEPKFGALWVHGFGYDDPLFGMLELTPAEPVQFTVPVSEGWVEITITALSLGPELEDMIYLPDQQFLDWEVSWWVWDPFTEEWGWTDYESVRRTEHRIYVTWASPIPLEPLDGHPLSEKRIATCVGAANHSTTEIDAADGTYPPTLMCSINAGSPNTHLEARNFAEPTKPVVDTNWYLLSTMDPQTWDIRGSSIASARLHQLMLCLLGVNAPDPVYIVATAKDNPQFDCTLEEGSQGDPIPHSAEDVCEGCDSLLTKYLVFCDGTRQRDFEGALRFTDGQTTKYYAGGGVPQLGGGCAPLTGNTAATILRGVASDQFWVLGCMGCGYGDNENRAKGAWCSCQHCGLTYTSDNRAVKEQPDCSCDTVPVPTANECP